MAEVEAVASVAAQVVVAVGATASAGRLGLLVARHGLDGVRHLGERRVDGLEDLGDDLVKLVLAVWPGFDLRACLVDAKVGEHPPSAHALAQAAQVHLGDSLELDDEEVLILRIRQVLE